MKRPISICLLSGGLDSSTLLYYLLSKKSDVVGLFVDYGQRHVQERVAARDVAHEANVELVEVDLSKALLAVFAGSSSSQVGLREDVPHGHYAAENMKTTIVPNRNMLLLATAGALAVSRGAQSVAYAAHAGDHAIYPDCRPEFADAMQQALLLGNDPGIILHRPFVAWSKTDIARQAKALGVPVQMTYSCYEGNVIHCGECGTCVERKEAFRDAGVLDPTSYADTTSV